MPPAQLRIGSLEILAALAVFGFAVSRFAPDSGPQTAAAPKAVRILLRVSEASVGGPRDVEVVLDPQAPRGLVGRSPDAAVVLRDAEVSRRHAMLALAGGVVYLSDTGSSNGTFLNGKHIGDEGIEICAGDEIDAGTTRIRVLNLEAEDERSS